MDIEEELRAAISEAGVAVEQIGLADGVQLEVDEEGEITLYLGEENDETFEDVDEARERIEEYAEEYGGDGSRPGAIVELVRRVGKLVEKVPERRRATALTEELFEKVLAIAGTLGLEHVRKAVVDDDCEVQADQDGDVGFFEDGNTVLWEVFVEDGDVQYRLFDR